MTHASIADLRTYYRALGDETRLRIVQILAAEGERSLTDIVDRLRISQPLVSWHMRRLRRAGIITTVRKGREVRCSIDRERFGQLHERGYRTLMNPARSER